MARAEFSGTGDLAFALANGRRLVESDPAAAVVQAREILDVNPVQGDALRLLGAALRKMDRHREAEQAELDAISSSSHNPVLVDAALALSENRLSAAEHLLRPYLERVPDDAAAIRMLAEIGIRVGAFPGAEALLRQALALAPAFASARLALSRVLFAQNRLAESLDVLDDLLSADPANARAQGSKAATLGRIGDYDEAIALYEQLLERSPGKPGIWMTYGHVLNTVGRHAESIAAYRQALTLDSAFGEVWWSLANLKTAELSGKDIATMLDVLDRTKLDDDSRFHIHFALGKAYEDWGEFEKSFRHYAKGNDIRRTMLDYDAAETTAFVHRSINVFTREFFEARAGQGCAAPDPIFIVGMPRAGSTLIEQILSSHSRIEGTSELPHIPALSRGLEAARHGQAFPDFLAHLGPDELKALGAEYLERARLHRKTDRPFFVDKLPNNWVYIGFIHLILPNARFIDARRHPLACCFSNFKQHFARGQGFTYSLADLGHYYSDYVDALAHFDTVLPGRIHRVFHENMVGDTEGEVRRLLAFLDLPFEPACLRFYENDRAVRTPSAEQVRRPINRDGLDRWRAFEAWLGPLKDALGPVLDFYPAVPVR